MSDKETKIKLDASDGGVAIAIAMLFIAFWGEPDLVDAIKFHLIGDPALLEAQR